MIKVSIIDDHELIRDGFTRLVNSQKDMVLIDSFSESKNFIKKINQIDIDVLVLDLSLKNENGLNVLKVVKALTPKLNILILSMYSEEQYALQALQFGASGFVSKGSGSILLLDAIRKIYSNGIFIPPTLGEIIAKTLRTPNSVFPHEKLTKREFQILCMLGKGLSTHDIALNLFISENTVRTHKRSIKRKMDLRSTAELIRYVIKNELTC